MTEGRGSLFGVAVFAAVLWMIIAIMGGTGLASITDLDNEAAPELTARIQAVQETERARIAENAQTQRERIRARTVGVVVGIAAAAVVGLAFAAARLFGGRAAQPIPPQILAAAAALLAEDTARRVEVVDGEWHVVDDARQELYPLALRPTPAQEWDTTPWTDVRPPGRRGSRETAVFDLENHEILTPEQWRARNG